MPNFLPLQKFLVMLLSLAVFWPTMLRGEDLTTWPTQYTIRPWESSRLTAADVVGPDGIVYPDFTGVGVTGGVPDINNSTVRATYTVFNVRTYGALGDGATNDDDAVAAAAAAVRTHLAASPTNKAILYFPAGTYVLSNPVLLNTSNAVIDGDGPDATVIKLATNTTRTGALFTLSRAANFSGFLVATAFVPRGSNTLTLNADPAANSFTVGSWVRLAATVSGAGKTISDRFNNPANNVIYSDAFYQTGRITFAKITAINSAARTVTLDRTFTHDYFVDESPQLRRMDMLENVGVQDLTIETVAATATVDPVRFENAANSWIKNIRTIKAKSWPVNLVGVTRFEVLDSQFLGTWIDLSLGGGVAYLGWAENATDALMDNCQASDLRHMAIFMMSNRCVIRNSTFTGKSVQSPQLHGRFPHENLIESSTFDTRSGDGSGSTRGITAYGSDGGFSMVHGVNGPRNVFYNNTVASGMGTAVFSGISEGFIFAYNRILKTNDIEAKPAIMARDRTFDMIVRGNIFQAIATLPAITLEDPTCTGWQVTDNRFYGTNGYLFEGDSTPEVVHNNRFFSAATPPPSATAPEVPSIFAWQKANAQTPRLVLASDRRIVTDTGGATEMTVVRVRAATTSSLTVNLSANTGGLSFPSTVTIPAGQTSATFLISGTEVSGEQNVTLTASAPDLLADSEVISVLDQGTTQPNFGGFKWPETVTGLPEFWKAGNYGIVSVPGAQSFANGTWTLTGAGVATETWHASLARSGRKFVYQTVIGDGEIRARITSSTGENQVGLMIADDEANHTDFFWVEPNGRVFGATNDPELGIGGGVPTRYATPGTRTVPSWLRLKRQGSVFTAYRSTVENPTSESDWTVLATVDLYQNTTTSYKSPAILDERMHFGMFINSGSASTTATATFTNVAITGAIDGAVPPVAPGGLAANLSGSNATLTWSDLSLDESGFQLESRMESGAWQLLASLPANSTSFQHTALLDGVTYSYRVRAIRTQPAGTSTYSNIATVFRPATTAPLAPDGLATAANEPSSIELSWTDNAYNETGFTIERSTTSGGGFAAIATLGANASGYTDAGLPEGARFFYRVRALNAIGVSSFSNEAAGVTLLLPPANAFVAESSEGAITLNWADVSSAESGYRIERRLATGGEFVVVGTTAANATSFTDTTVTQNSRYLYRIQSFNTITASAFAAEVTATAAADTFSAFYEPFDYDLAVSTSVIGQFGSGRGSSGIWGKIVGSNPADRIQSGSLVGGGITTLGNHLRLGEVSASSRIGLTLNNTTREIIYPPANGSRTFWVSFLCRTPGTLSGTFTPGLALSSATNTDVLHMQTWTGDTARRFSLAGSGLTTVNSANSTVTTSTTYLYLARVTLSDTNGNAGDGIERVRATLWQFPSGSTLPTMPPPDETGISIPETTVSSRIITKLILHGAAAGAANAFLYDEIRLGQSYAQVALTTPTQAIGRPQGISVTHLANGSFRLRWLDNANAETGYQIERRSGAEGAWNLVATTAANAIAHTDAPPTAGQEFFYRIRAVNGGGQGEWSEAVSILSPGIFSDPASITHSQPTNRTTPLPVTLYNRASIQQTFTVTAASGSAAYSLATSNQPGGPAYMWNDISTTGTVITSLNNQDDRTSSEQIPIGFSFPFYGNSFTSFRVSSNGWLSFDPSVGSLIAGHYFNTTLPNSDTSGSAYWLPPSSIAFLWDDLRFLDTAPASRAYYQQIDADTLVLQFSNIRHYSDGTIRLNLQVHLKRNGDILIYYRDGSLNDHSYTIGIQNATRTEALQAAFNTEYVSTNFALRFRPPAPWLSVSPTVITIPAQSAAQVVPTLNSTGIASGTRESFLSVRSDSPGQPAFDVPVSLTISSGADFPLPPDNLVAMPVDGAITLTWIDHATNETGYELQRSRDQITWSPWSTLPANTTSTTDSSGAPGTWFYRVRATASPISSPWSPSASISISSLPDTFSLSGQVTAGGSPLAGVVLSAAQRTTVTDATGNYEIGSLPPGGYTITPSLVGYSFTPASRNQTLTTASVGGLNFAATVQPEIALTRAGGAVADGGTDPITGTAMTVATPLTYTITNHGLASLSLSSATVSATTNCAVSITNQPAGTVVPGNTTSLVLSVTPAAAGPWSFQVSLPNNDLDENPYDWTVAGNASFGNPNNYLWRPGGTVDAGGTWNTTTANWFLDPSTVAWPNRSQPWDNARFGLVTQTRTVSIPSGLSARANALIFTSLRDGFGTDWIVDGPGTLELEQDALIDPANGQNTVRINAPISGNSGLRIQSSGTRHNQAAVILAGANTYSGGTTVSHGTLLAANTSGSATGTGAVSMASGTRLGGTGTLAGAVTLQSGSALAFSITTPSISHDRLDIGGALNLSGSNTVHISATSGASPGTYTLLTAAGGISGPLPALSLPENWVATLQISGNHLNLVVTATRVLYPPVVNAGQAVIGAVGQPIYYTVQASNSPTSYALASGTLPPGLTLNPANGVLYGTPTTAGSYTPSFTATNSDGTSSAVSVSITIDNGVLIVNEPFGYTLASTNPDPDGGLNSGNGLPATNVGGNPASTSTGLRGNWGTDQTVMPGLTYSNAGGTLSTSGGALRQNTATGWGVGQAWMYRSMITDPFASRRYASSANWLGWNGSSPSELFVSVLLNASATGSTNNRALTLITGQNNAQWSVYLRESGGNWMLSDQGGTNRTLGTAVANQTVFVVVRYSFTSATTMTIDAWMNPTLGAPLGTPSGTLSYTALTSGGDFRGFQTRNDTADVLTIDELRIGTSAASVMPIRTSSFTVSFDANGGSAPSPASKLVTLGGIYGTLPSISRPGYTFEGWFTSPAGGTRITESTTVVLETNHSLYAQWGVQSGYAAWLASYPALTGSEALANADPDGDGIANLLEYALGGHPQQASSAPRPTAGTSGNRLTLTFTPASTSGLRYLIEASPDLSNWTEQVDVTALLSIGQAHTYIDSVDLAPANPRRFLRLRIQQSP